jgi:hypothetical protein
MDTLTSFTMHTACSTLAQMQGYQLKPLFSSRSHLFTHLHINPMSPLYSAYMIILKTTSLDFAIAQQA